MKNFYQMRNLLIITPSKVYCCGNRRKVFLFYLESNKSFGNAIGICRRLNLFIKK